MQKVAPYLTIDSAPYPAVVDGSIKWIVDGYTTSVEYPYSRPRPDRRHRRHYTPPDLRLDEINYIRNSVKATVDAYDGTVEALRLGHQDPVLKTWQKIFPSTLTPLSRYVASSS